MKCNRLYHSVSRISLCSAALIGLSVAPALAQKGKGSTQQAQPQQSEQNYQRPSLQSPAVSPIGANVSVTDQQLHNAANDADNWLLYGRTYDNDRYSPLHQINAENVGNLKPVAIMQTGVSNTFEDSPIEVNGILYTITANDHVQAYDATNGNLLWKYDPNLNYSALCCGPEARGVAVAYGHVYVPTLDARLIALDARTGKEEWQTNLAKALSVPNPTAYSITMAPQVYNGKVFVGSSGAEYQTRGFVAALDAKTGKVDWVFRTTAAPDQPGGNSWSDESYKTGGGSMWNTPAVDQNAGLILFSVGNPNPDNWGENRKGANAYTDSIVALHANDGSLAWWYQETPHDLWDYDAAAPVVLFNVKDQNGVEVPAAAEAPKEGQVFIVNRENGKLIRTSEPFVQTSKTMWTVPAAKPVIIYPGAQGGNEWSPESYSPQTGMFYVMGTNEAWIYTGSPPGESANTKSSSNNSNSAKGKSAGSGSAASNGSGSGNGNDPIGMTLGGKLKPVTSPHPQNTIAPSGDLSAINVNTGKIDWQYQSDLPMVGGVTSTGGNLVFAGEMNGNFDAFDARTGKLLWKFPLGAGVDAPPITYRVNGVQYVAVAAGGNGANSNPQMMRERNKPPFGEVIAIFALPNKG